MYLYQTDGQITISFFASMYEYSLDRFSRNLNKLAAYLYCNHVKPYAEPSLYTS